jgi:hypothetical protein
MAAIGSAATFFIHKPNLKAFIVRLFVVRGLFWIRLRVALAAVAARLVDRKTAGADHFAADIYEFAATGLTRVHCSKLRTAANVSGGIRAVYAPVPAAFSVL